MSAELVRAHGELSAELQRAKEFLASCRAQNEGLVVDNVKLRARVEALVALLSDSRHMLRSVTDSIERLTKESWK
jgi:hypothetical protein